MAKYGKIKRYKHSYRVRKRRRTILIKSVLFLLAAFLLVAAGYFAFQAISYYTDLQDQPLSSEEESLPSSEETSLPESSFSGSSSQPSQSEGEQESDPSPTDTSFSEGIRAVTVSCASIPELKERLQAIDKESFNAVLLLLKDAEGKIYYDTASSHAKSCGAVSQTAFSLTEAEAAIRSAGFIPLAKLYTLRDNIGSHATYDNSYLYNGQAGTSWLDNTLENGGRTWLNPYKANTASYLCELTEEIAKAGFKGIIAYGCQYPTTTNRYRITYGDTGGVSLQDAIGNLLQKLSDTASQNGSSLIPAYLGSCYQQEVNSHIYGGSPNDFSISPSVPLVSGNLALLNYVSADRETLIPAVASLEEAASLAAYDIKQYIVE